MDRIPGRPAVVVRRWIYRRAVGIDSAVGIQSQGQEGGRPVAASETRPTVRLSTGRRGRSGVSWRRWVERRISFAGGSKGVSRPRMPAARMSVSRSAPDSAIYSQEGILIAFGGGEMNTFLTSCCLVRLRLQSVHAVCPFPRSLGVIWVSTLARLRGVLQSIATLITAGGVLLAVLTLRASQRQRLRQFESFYVARYWHLMNGLPLAA